MSVLPAERHFFRGDEGYEPARRATVWHQRVPERYPEVIVQAVDADDVVAAIRYASSKGLRMSICSGGGSWAANHIRDGAVLLDVSRLDHAAIDADRKIAVVGPGTSGSALAGELDTQGLFFPVAHCRGVRVGGYLLQGGYGWNSRVLGPACESVVGVDVVTANGEQIHCDADNHADLYWAARGSGPGFFGVVTSFHLKLHPRPEVCGTGLYLYPFELADEIYAWARDVSADVDRRVELAIVASRSIPSAALDSPAIVVTSPVFADTEEAAEKSLALLGASPTVDKAILKIPYSSTDLATLSETLMTNYLADHRYAVDNMWTSASADDLLPGIHRIIDTMPAHPSHFVWQNWGPSPPRQDMAYSVEDEIYLALYGAWKDPADDDKYGDWAGSNMAAMAGLASGIQLADENLGQRPAKFATDENMDRLDQVRAVYDPDALFYSWLGRV